VNRKGNHTSLKTSPTADIVTSAIIKACAHKIQSGRLYREIVIEKRLCSRGTFYECLKELYSCESPRIARSPQTGNATEVFYVVIERKNELGASSGKASVSAMVIPEKNVGSTSVLATSAIKKALSMIDRIDENDNWRKPRMINSICIKELWPFLHSLRNLRRTGYPIRLPWEYDDFFTGRPKAFRSTLFGTRDLSGPIYVPRPEALVGLAEFGCGRHRSNMLVVKALSNKVKSSRDAFVCPTLHEWQNYLRDVINELEKGLPDTPIDYDSARRAADSGCLLM
jgi:hypothetical protein